MARYSHLPIYRAMYAFVRSMFQVQQKLPQSLKFTLGQKVFDSSLRCLKGIVVANGSKNKTKILSELTLEIEVIWTYLRLLHDLRGISSGEFGVFSEQLSEIGKQLSAWTKWNREQQQP